MTNQSEPGKQKRISNMESRKEQASSCRTPGMAGRKALVTFRISLPYNFRPAPRDIKLYGSWSSYESSIPMERDQRAGHGIWKSLGPKGGLEQGAVYGYYYIMDGNRIWYDPGAGRTVKDDRTGKVVNVIEVPIELPSEEDDVSPRTTAINVDIQSGLSGEDLEGGQRERSYEKSHRVKAYEQLTGASAPLPPSHTRHHEYTNNSQTNQTPRKHEVVPSPASSSSTIAPTSQNPQTSCASIQQYEYSSSSSAAAENSRPPYQSSKSNKSNNQSDENFPPKISARRKPAAQPSLPLPQETPMPAPLQPKKTREGQSSQKPRKKSSFTTYLSRKISIPSLPPSPVPGPTPQGNSVSPSAPPPPPVRHSTFSHIEAHGFPESTNPISSAKRRWSFLPTGNQSSTTLPSDPSPSPALNSPKRKAGRFFSLAGLGRLTPTSDSNNRGTNFNLNSSHTSVNTIISHPIQASGETRRHRDPTPLDIPPPPDFVMENSSRRNQGRESKISGDLEREKKKSLRGLLGGESRSGKRASVTKRWTRSRNGSGSRGSELEGSNVTVRGTMDKERENKSVLNYRKETNENPLLISRSPLPRSFSVASSTLTTGSTAAATVRSYSNFGRESSIAGGEGFVMVGSSSDSESVNDSLDRIERCYSIRSMKPTEPDKDIPEADITPMLTPVVSQVRRKPIEIERRHDLSSAVTCSMPVPTASVTRSMIAATKLNTSRLSTSLPAPPAPLSINTNLASYSPHRRVSNASQIQLSTLSSKSSSRSLNYRCLNKSISPDDNGETPMAFTKNNRSELPFPYEPSVAGGVPVGSVFSASPTLSLRIRTGSRNHRPSLGRIFSDTATTLRLHDPSLPNDIEDEDNGDGGMFIMMDDLDNSAADKCPLFPLTGRKGRFNGIEMEMTGLNCLSRLREEAQGELENKKEMWEELGWLGEAVV